MIGQRKMVEINFDGIVGPTHNYAGLSHGNLAATRNAGATSFPRAAALQGVAKMRANLALGLVQGILLPHDRPNTRWLAALASDVRGPLWPAAASASAMWAANAATVSPAADTADGRCHLSVANLVTMPHRSHEWPETLAQLRTAFADPAFVVHTAIPAPYGDEGAANHMRLTTAHDAPGVEVFVYGEPGGRFPARQHPVASQAIARRHALDPARTVFVRQSPEAIAAGAFHNDVVAVANEHVLFAHEQAFADRHGFYETLRKALPSLEIVEVPASAIGLEDAIASYLFNAQLVTLPGGGGDDSGGMALILPTEAQANVRVWSWLEALIAGNGPIRRLIPVDVRESMANGGGPACLRLRVVCDPAAVDPRFLVDADRLDRIADVVEHHWPERVDAHDHNSLGDWPAAQTARQVLFDALDLSALLTD
ncbi:MAG TPA: N-succinylarginine dihydrolase [Sphingomonas sp.]|jgi:succinylarginine dihydrolase|nr:N-succinylarginine dihydrolase [Sphingomonas sp.]